jgi:8-oxo-dGTP pyrophosphatase MutT (NUDIX family)
MGETRMNVRFVQEAEFTGFVSTLRERMNAHEPRRIQNSNCRDAAVLIPIFNKNNEACVLVTKRTDTVATHRGQMALPGGAYDIEDGSRLITALRETEEEVGIHRDHVEVIGEFDEFISIAGFHVASFVGIIPHPYEYAINPEEIDAYVEVPLSIFLNREFEKVEKVEYNGRSYDVYFYRYEGFQIWGLTARILTDFADKLLGG